MPYGHHISAAGNRSLDDGREELVANEEPPARTGGTTSVPVLYYTTAGGRAGEEVTIVTNSVGGQYIVTPSGRPEDLDPKQKPVTEERLARLRCFTILALITAPLVGVFVLMTFLRCRRAFLMANSTGGGALELGTHRTEAALWAGRVERLFVLAMFCVLAELVIILLAVEYQMRVSGAFLSGV